MCGHCCDLLLNLRCVWILNVAPPTHTSASITSGTFQPSSTVFSSTSPYDSSLSSSLLLDGWRLTAWRRAVFRRCCEAAASRRARARTGLRVVIFFRGKRRSSVWSARKQSSNNKRRETSLGNACSAQNQWRFRTKHSLAKKKQKQSHTTYRGDKRALPLRAVSKRGFELSGTTP